MKKFLLLLVLLSGSLYAQPPIAQPNDLWLCDQNSDGFEAFDLTSTISEILNELNPALYTESFYTSLVDAQNEASPIANPSSYINSSNPETIYVRVLENANPSNFAITEFDLIVNPQPSILQPSDLIIYESPFDETAVFDLSFQTSFLINGLSTAFVSFFTTEANAISNTGMIGSTTAFSNTSNPQTIYCRVADTETGCFSITNFDLVVRDANIVYIPDVNFKAKLLQANTNNTIAKDMNGVNIKVDINDDNEIQVSEALSVFRLSVSNSSIVSMEGLASFSNLQQLECSSNLITEIDISTLQNLTNFWAYSNPLITLDCNNNSNIQYIGIQSATLQYLLIKNGVDENLTMDPGSWQELFCCSPNLEYVCCDESQLTSVMEMLAQFNLENVEVNSYCNFTPGGNYNTVTGTVHYDANNNGCDETDFTVPFFRLMVDLNTVSTNSSVFTNSQGTYNFYTTNEGTYSFNPSIENPSFFTINPQPGIATIEEIDNTTTNLDFCISANGVHPDLEIVIAPVIPARPGFEAKYLIVYKNKGNQIMSQEYGVNFFYNQHLMNFVSSSVVPSSQAPGGMQWSFENLMPFESRRIEVTMAINPPTDSQNPVNINDELIFTSIILPQAGDEIVQDNTFVFNQTVVGSYDPNDIICLQGDIVSPVEIGNFLHYLIRFENTGNAPAEKIVVKVEVDPNQYDYNSLQVLATSNDASLRMNANVIEFIFQNIQLESGGHGNILLKMKTNETLQVGDYVEKRANIYFDYNFPIQTNEAETLFQALSVVNPILDSLISICPNPVKDIVNITINDNSTIKTIELYDIQGRLLQTQVVNNITSELNLSSRANGMYFIKINTDKGSKVEKLIKE